MLKFLFRFRVGMIVAPFVFSTLALAVYGYYQLMTLQVVIQKANAKENNFTIELEKALTTKKTAVASLEAFLKEDQYLRNEALELNIKNIETTYKDAVNVYEQLLKLREQSPKTEPYDKSFASILNLLQKREYASASATITQLKTDISKKQAELAAAGSSSVNVAVNNSAPGTGYRRQNVQSDIGTFLVDIIAADLNSTKVIVDTSSEGDCGNDCPVLPLGDFAARSGAFAAINGPYFCPSTYPSCADKKNSFDTLIMNKNKKYFNSDNNVYSVVPAVIFSGNSARWVNQSLEWGRDTGVDSVIANQPLLVKDGSVVFGGDSEIKRSSRGARSFIGGSGSNVYIGIVYNANVAEVARVLKTLGIQNALNLDSGGSTALWSNGRYIIGPGRSLPFGILLVRK